MISVEIPVIWGTHLDAVLESVRLQSNQDHETIVVNSSADPAVHDILQEYDVKEVNLQTGLLNARFLAHQASIGEQELLLDETRVLDKTALETLERQRSDMVVAGEEEVGDSVWSKLTNLDRKTALAYAPEDLVPGRGFLLPRYFKRALLEQAFSSLQKKLKPDVFARIINGDHLLIYSEAYDLSRSISVIAAPLISHYGDDSLRKIIAKYYRYGRSDKARVGFGFGPSHLRFKRRRAGHLLTLRILPLVATRSVAYLLGLWL